MKLIHSKLIRSCLAFILFTLHVTSISVHDQKTSSALSTVFEFLKNYDSSQNMYKKFDSFLDDDKAKKDTPQKKLEEPSKKSEDSSKKSEKKNSEEPQKNLEQPQKKSVEPTNPNIVNLNDRNVQLSDWLSISSPAFNNPTSFPNIANQQIRLGTEQKRLNEKYQSDVEKSNKFLFRVRGGYIYYSSDETDLNLLGTILAQKVTNSEIKNKKANSELTCFEVYDNSQVKSTICASDMKTKLKWMCSLQKFLNQELDYSCVSDQLTKLGNLTISSDNIIEVKKTTQPVIIIPLPSKNCNEKWNYLNKGKDWECICKESNHQSPIDLPLKDKAILSDVRPMFEYDIIHAQSQETTLDGLIESGSNIKIRYDRGAIKIYHPNMGKIITPDGGVFQAEEIVFHTPSEHTVNGVQQDMEMQVIHYGRSKGDIAKQVVLSFLFKKKPGIFNKFIDKLDYFNLPNPADTFRELKKDLYIPEVFYTPEDDDLTVMRPFSFYTYQGSLTSPPCTERTIHYVASEPIEISNIVIELFKEALKMPDIINEKGEIVQSADEAGENNRSVQELNNRTVFIYDHIKFNCPEFKKKQKQKLVVKPAGHYEKRVIDVNEYVFVSGDQPSGMPGTFVVGENEAKGG